MDAAFDHGGLMDRVYRRQRHIYDATRKYYLLGRDPMIAGLLPPAGGAVLEIGCGTGRNLVKAASRYPQASFFGIDISSEMLATAGAAVAGAGLQGRIRLAQADAAGFDPAKVFGRQGFDRVFVSYALSMIPGWERVLADAIRMLAPGGELHVVDFGDLGRLPRICRPVLYQWLRWHHVSPRLDLFKTGARLARGYGCAFEERRLHRGFAWIAVIRRPGAALSGQADSDRNFSTIASPMPAVPTSVMPGDMMSRVRLPSSSTAEIATSSRSASATMLKE